MSYQILSKKHRPQTFGEVVGQQHVVRTLRNAILSNRIAGAYLFTGPRGVGKTSLARILAKTLNCKNGITAEPCGRCECCLRIAEGRSLDVFEIDGASNNGIEQIRELKASLRSGSSGCRFKIYIIDEVHMLSTSAFSSLQRVVEEPPPHSKFIFATTEMDKLPSTFSSRCQCLCLQPLSANDIARHLLWIAAQEGFELSEEAALRLAEASDGGLRDAESMLDQVLTLRGNKVEAENICKDLGIVDVLDASRLITHIFNGDLKAALLAVEIAEINGTNLKELSSVASALIRDVFLAQAGGEGGYRRECISPLVGKISLDNLIDLMGEMSTAGSAQAVDAKGSIETAIIRSVQTVNSVSVEEVIDVLASMVRT